MWEYYNPNPSGKKVGDCVVRAIAKVLDTTWEDAYTRLAVKAYAMSDMPSSDIVWGSLLRDNGYVRESIPNTCPDCYTAEDFCDDYPDGKYVLSFGGHVATVCNGVLYDSWDSSNEIPIYFWYEDEESEDEENVEE